MTADAALSSHLRYQVAVVALRDLLRQISTTHVAAQCRKRAIQVAAGGAVWFVTAMLMIGFLTNPAATGVVRVVIAGVIVVWSPGLLM